MERTRIKLGVFVDLAVLPGPFYSAEAAQHAVRNLLTREFPHSRPTVSVDSYGTRKEYGEKPQMVVVKKHQTESWNPGPPLFCVVATDEGAAKRWIQDEVDGKHDPSFSSFAKGKTADWWLAYGTFSITPVEAV